MNAFPPFESVYDHIEGYGRTKSISYRMWKGARKAVVPIEPPPGVSPKKEKARHKKAVARLREMRKLLPRVHCAWKEGCFNFQTPCIRSYHYDADIHLKNYCAEHQAFLFAAITNSDILRWFRMR